MTASSIIYLFNPSTGVGPLALGVGVLGEAIGMVVWHFAPEHRERTWYAMLLGLPALLAFLIRLCPLHIQKLIFIGG